MADFPLAHPLFVLACSPRRNGNSDTAARLFAAGFAHEAGTAATDSAPDVVFLREHAVSPCIACDACAGTAHDLAGSELSADALAGRGGSALSPPFACPLTRSDASAPLLCAFAGSPALCIVSPVYFYHLPAVLKGLIDRLQCFWSLRESGVRGWAFPGPRTCHIVLLGARARGDKLFEGSLLTLQYALRSLNILPAAPLLLYGLDGPGDLKARPEAREEVFRYGANAGKIYRENSDEAGRA